MLENLKIAVKRQKKLIFIFILTIFIPAITLSIFGVIAIRNEKFRRAEQVENEHRRAAEFLRSQTSMQIKDLENVLLRIAQNPAVIEQNYPGVVALAEADLADQDLVEEVLLAYKDGTREYPLFVPKKKSFSSAVLPPLSPSQGKQLKSAEENEFKLKRFRAAISGYSRLYNLFSDKNRQAQMLHNIARCYTKLNNQTKAIENYLRLIREYPESFSFTGLPLSLLAQLQLLDCYKNMGDAELMLKDSLKLYADLLDKPWDLNADQYKTYTALTLEKIHMPLPDENSSTSLAEARHEFKQLQERHHQKSQRWQIVSSIETQILPELMRRITERNSSEDRALSYVTAVDGQNYLILAIRLLDESVSEALGLLGVKLNDVYMTDTLLPQLIQELQLSEKTNILISDLSGNILLGNRPSDQENPTATGLFEGNFPPWRMQFFEGESEDSGILSIRKSFYFWTILTLIIILFFGSALIMRTVAHEMDILKIKSDFVSSVSHEFKTPLTSIKALVERLREGKVLDSAKLNQYYSVIAQDTEKLTRLVKNVLDFSKIEEGKVEYNLVDTDMCQWLGQQVESFQQNEMAKNIKIHCLMDQNIPSMEVDRDAMSQVIVNLLGNAVKFSPNETEIHTVLKKNEDLLILEVKDQGIGIPPDELDKVFDKFYQGRSAQKLTVKGTGLGLTLVKHIVEAHGGKISVESMVGEGTTFSLTLPLRSL
ncbi:MAG: hypothetical protein GQ544_07635 [Candidatus Aminicenantes bacterium]|nr:hypothetical protein [Candidatus Aminicenantes bacterium]